MEGHALISPDVLARYAADAARDVEGVSVVSEPGLARPHASSVRGEEGEFAVQVHVRLEWGRSAPAVGAAVQESVKDYLERMAAVRPSSVDVVVDGIGSPPQGT